MGISPMVFPTVAEIDLAAFADNVQSVRAQLSHSCDLMAVIKADAYGHGATRLATVALREGASWLAVARCQEGIKLRQHGIDAPILILGPVWAEEVSALLAYRLTPTVSSVREAGWLEREAGRRKMRCGVHVKVDTGMGRLGLTTEQMPTLLKCLRRLDSLDVEGLMTHLATADAPGEHLAQLQLERFSEAVEGWAKEGITPTYIHAANSAAVYRYPHSHYTLVRAGLALYGSSAVSAATSLKPVLTWKTRLARLQDVAVGQGISYGHTFVASRPSCIGTLSVGYADGLSRALSNVGEVLVRGQRAPIVGQITMDMCMIDLTDIPLARHGDEVVLIGAQDADCLSADDMAAKCGRIPYEIFCAISSRVTRQYIS